MRHSVRAAALLVALLASSSIPDAASAEAVGPACTAPEAVAQIDEPLRRTALALASGDPVVIVAVGSSSTSGAGASSPAHTYPARLEAELNARFPGSPITVLNRGVGGEDAREMLARFSEQVIKERPDLVIWQVGTNAVLRDHALAGEAPLIREGVRRLKASFADIVLIDSQYAPRVLAKPHIQGMVELMAKTAREERVGLFERFAIMRHWVEVERVPFSALLSPDGLHMNDWSYACIAKLLANAVAEAANRASPAIAKVRRTR